MAEFNLAEKFRLKPVFREDVLAAQPALLLSVPIALLMPALLHIRQAFPDFSE